MTLVLAVKVALAAALLTPAPPHAPCVWLKVHVYSILPIQNCMYMYETLPEPLSGPLKHTRTYPDPQYLVCKVRIDVSNAVVVSCHVEGLHVT